MPESRSVNRRGFLKHSAGAAFAFTIVPRHVCEAAEAGLAQLK